MKLTQNEKDSLVLPMLIVFFVAIFALLSSAVAGIIDIIHHFSK